MSLPAIRSASLSDRESLIHFILMAGDGIFEQLFDASLPGLSARRALSAGMNLNIGPYTHRNAFLLCNLGKVAACLLCFPGGRLSLPRIARWSLPNSRVSPLVPVFSSDLEDSFYINTLAVSAPARGRGFARQLLGHANDLAAEGGYPHLALHVWADNPAALKLYLTWGFEIEAELIMPSTHFLRRKGPLLLARAPVRSGRE